MMKNIAHKTTHNIRTMAKFLMFKPVSKYNQVIGNRVYKSNKYKTDNMLSHYS